MPVKSKNKKTTKWVIPAIIIAAVFIVGVVFIFGKGTETGSLPTSMSVSEAADLFKEGAFLLDVRQTEEWVQGHIEGAVSIPLGELQYRTSEIPTDRDILIICRTGNRSSQARSILRAAGFKRTTSIIGGFNAWIANGLPVIKGH